MKNKVFKTILGLSVISFLFFINPSIAFLAETPGLPNPLPGIDTLGELIVRVLQVTLGLVGVIAVAVLIYGGLVMITSSGNPERVKKAKDILLWAILGIAVIVISGTLVNYVLQTLQNVGG